MKSRTDYAIKNSMYSGITSVLNLCIQVLVRTFIIKIMGEEILGLNSLFTDILSILSMVELGIGPALVYSLYLPLSKKKYAELNSLMFFFKKIYIYIAIAILIIGILLMFFLPNFVKINSDFSIVFFVYFLFLLNSVISYFFAYNRSLLFADQKGYYVIVVDCITKTVGGIFQIILLFLFKNYLLFLFIQIFMTFFSNFFINQLVQKKYKKIFKSKKEKLSKIKKMEIIKFFIGKASDKIGGCIVLGTDSIFISYFLGLKIVGIYDNYRMMLMSLYYLITSILNSVGGGIGNLAVEEDDQTAIDTFKTHSLITLLLSIIVANGVMLASSPLIKLWIGKEFLLSREVIILMLVDFFLRSIRTTAVLYGESFGLAWQQRWKAIIEAILNIFFSLLFLIVFKLGVIGILLGTIIGSLLALNWYEPYIVFKHALHIRYIKYIKYFIIQIFVFVFTLSLSTCLDILLPNDNFFSLIYRIIISLIISSGFIILFYFKSSEFKNLIDLINKMIKKYI
ncbi:MAG: hypothetical protein LBI41_00850 [Lactobacillales bacterium]|nr:hypothetical protein [Lactobacillales bacterium]